MNFNEYQDRLLDVSVEDLITDESLRILQAEMQQSAKNLDADRIAKAAGKLLKILAVMVNEFDLDLDEIAKDSLQSNEPT